VIRILISRHGEVEIQVEEPKRGEEPWYPVGICRDEWHERTRNGEVLCETCPSCGSDKWSRRRMVSESKQGGCAI
jgi:hypothetical protein